MAAYVKTVVSPATPEPIVQSDRRAKRLQTIGREEVEHLGDLIQTSSLTGRVLVGELCLNKAFPKSYSSPDEQKRHSQW